MGSQKQPKILIIDDDESIVAAMEAILESKDYEVVTAYNKEDGLKQVADAQPDLIVLDVMMSHMTDGFQIARKLKADPETENIPILMVTAIHKELDNKLSPGVVRYSPETDDEYLPVDDFVDKPIRPADLLSRVGKLLDKTREDG